MHRNWKTLIKPNNLEAVELTEVYGKFVAKPLERGYGVTLGNSIRRVLLSSINGLSPVIVITGDNPVLQYDSSNKTRIIRFPSIDSNSSDSGFADEDCNL